MGKASTEGLTKPSNLEEVKALNNRVLTSDKNAGNYLKVLLGANEAAQKMTTHADADAEVAALRVRFDKVNTTKDEWVKKVDVLLKEWTLLDNTVTELNSWVVKDKTTEGENTFLSGEDGVHPLRTEEHLRREGETCIGLVSPDTIKQIFDMFSVETEQRK